MNLLKITRAVLTSFYGRSGYYLLNFPNYVLFPTMFQRTCTITQNSIETKKKNGFVQPQVPHVAVSVLVQTTEQENLFSFEVLNKRTPCSEKTIEEELQAPKRKKFYLLVQRLHDPARGKWAFPGGKVKFGESISSAGFRELAEETGIQRHDLLLSTDAALSTDAISERQHYVISTINVTLPYEKRWTVSAADDAAAVQWCTFEEVAKLQHKGETVGNLIYLINQFKRLEEIDPVTNMSLH